MLQFMVPKFSTGSIAVDVHKIDRAVLRCWPLDDVIVAPSGEYDGMLSLISIALMGDNSSSVQGVSSVL